MPSSTKFSNAACVIHPSLEIDELIVTADKRLFGHISRNTQSISPSSRGVDLWWRLGGGPKLPFSTLLFLDLRVAAVQKHDPTWGWNRPQVDRRRLGHIRLDFTWQWHHLWHVTWVDFKRLQKFRRYDELAWMLWLDFLYLFCLWVIKKCWSYSY